MKKIIKYKNYLLGVIVILLAFTMIVGVKYLMKPKYEELPEVKLRNIKSSKSFAIMIQNGDGYEEYISEENTWPGSDYVFKEAKCTDNNGALVNDGITFENGKATLTTNQTIYCTLYFDKKSIPEIVKYLKQKDTQGYLSEDLQGEMYRYQAVPTDANEAAQMTNWICFGTTDKEQCTNEDTGIDKYMYRIIGITEEGQIYLLKETFLKEGNTIGFAWNSYWHLPECLRDICEWSNGDLYKRLNGTESNGNPIFVNNNEYGYMAHGEEWYNLIEDHNWMYGDTNTKEISIIYNGNAMYGIETGKIATKRYWPDERTQTTCSNDNQCTEKNYTWSKSISAKIGLMYIHDVLYAYPGGNPGSDINVKNSWIFFQKDGYNMSKPVEWLITRFGVYGPTGTTLYAWVINANGTLDDAFPVIWYGERPVFYLESKAKIASGDGTKSNPFILEI